MKTAFRGVIFDLDGTLVDSMPVVLRAFAHAVSPFAKVLTEDEWRSRMGGPPTRILAGVLANRAAEAEALVRLNEYNRLHGKQLAAFEGMKPLLTDLVDAGFPLGIWTGRDRESADIICAAHRIREKLKVCICGDDLPNHKPDPAGLSLALHTLGIHPANALFVGDAEVDVLAGAELEVKTLMITHGLSVSTEVGSRAWQLVGTPLEAYSLIRTEFLGS